MTANVDPIFSRVHLVTVGQGIVGPNANTAMDGSGANCGLVFQADTSNGSFIQKIMMKAVGAPAATVARFFLCSVTSAITFGTTNTSSNTNLIAEVTLPQIVTQSNVAAQPPIDVPLNIGIPAGYQIFVAYGTSTGSAGTGYVSTPIAGAY